MTMWTIENNNIANNGTIIATVVNGTVNIVIPRRIPIRILQQAGADQHYIDMVRANDARHEAARRDRRNDGFDFTRTFGVEIECYHPDNGYIKRDLCDALNEAGIPCEIYGYTHRIVRGWKIVHDGSLTGENTMELVSPVLKGSRGFTTIKKVLEIVNSLGIKVNSSCGMHVHHQADDVVSNHLNCYQTYVKNEQLLDGLMPPSRREDRSRWAQSLTTIDYDELHLNHGENGRNDWRYYKLNFQCYYVYGTVEFRQHSGTTDYEKISNWIKLTQAILLRGNGETKFANVEQMCQELKVPARFFVERFQHFSG